MSLLIGISNFIGRRAKYLRSAWETVVTQLKATFRYRVAGGADNDDLPESNGRAVIDTIYGNTVKWNQLIRNGDFNNGTTSWSIRQSGGLVVNNGIASYIKKIEASTNRVSQACTIKNNHVYVFGIDIREFNSINDIIWRIGSTVNTGEPNQTIFNTHYVGKQIVRFTAEGDFSYIEFGMQSFPDLEIDDVVCKFTNVQLFDLTEKFGKGNEPSTTDDFKEWLTLNAGEQDSFPYDEGSLISFKGQGVRTVKNNVELDRMTLDVIKIYGQVDGEGSYIQCFPCGMNAISKDTHNTDVDLKDTLSVDTAVRRLGYKALKDVEDYYVNATTRRFSLGDDRRYSSTSYFNATLVSPRYTLAVRGSSSANQADLTIQLNDSYTSVGNSYVKDSSEDPDIIRAALDQSYIVYELADYITYTNLIYSEDGGVTGTPLSELKYKVDKYSTEELLVPASVAGEPTSTALVADIKYQKK